MIDILSRMMQERFVLQDKILIAQAIDPRQHQKIDTAKNRLKIIQFLLSYLGCLNIIIILPYSILKSHKDGH